MYLIQRLQKLSPIRLALLSVVFSVVVSEAIVGGMELLLKGGVTYDYLLTGFVTSLCVAALVTAALIFFLDQQRLATQRVEAFSGVLSKNNIQLMQDQKFLDDIINSLAGVFYMLDDQGRFVRWNVEAEKVTGYSADELARMHSLDLFSGDDKPLIADKMREVFEKGESFSEANLAIKNGRQIPYYFTGRLTSVGEKPYLVGLGVDISERKRAEETLRGHEEKLRSVFEGSSDAIMLLTENGFFDCNERTLEMFGIDSKQEFVVCHPSDLSPHFQADGRESFVAANERIQLAFEHGSNRFEWTHRRKSGENFPAEVLLSAFEYDGERVLQATVRDISERKQAELALRSSEEKLRAMFEMSPLGIARNSMDGRFIEANAALVDMLGYGLAELNNLSYWEITPREYEGHEALQLESLEKFCRYGPYEKEYINRQGQRFPVRLSGMLITDSDGEKSIWSIIENITDRKKTENLMYRLAHYDALTGLPNRTLFLDRLGQEIKKSNRSGLVLTLLYIDLDQFKEVNDTLGHHVGDALLIDAAHRIEACVRETDTVARLGGDEFTVILAGLDGSSRVEHVAQAVIKTLTEPFQVGGETVYVSASIGITVYPADASDAENLLKNADQAMYVAKNSGRNRFSYFTTVLQEKALARSQLVKDLRGALAAGQFKVYFQPIVELATGGVCKAEALIRWQHPERGMVSPAEFIPLAEETGLINEIGDWVFRESVHWAKRWNEICHHGFQVSVNKSPVQFLSEIHHDDWLDYLRELELSGQCVTIEITEGLLLNAAASVTDKLLRFRDAGIQVSIDDFGTGYSALSYLKKFDIDYLKIDQSFVRNLVTDPSDLALSEAIIVMAHKLGLKVIAEGVETAEQRQILAAAGCDYGQGYLFSKAVPPEEFERLLRAAVPYSAGS